MYMSNDVMIRTQVYLSREQEQALKSLAITSGTRQSELIREAVDLFLSKRNALQRQWKKALQDMKTPKRDTHFSLGNRQNETKRDTHPTDGLSPRRRNGTPTLQTIYPRAGGGNHVFDFDHCRVAGLLSEHHPCSNAG